MLFAAGFGTRMRPLTDDRPKPMIHVAGMPLIEHALAIADGVSPETVVVNLHYKREMLIDYLTGRRVQTILETPDILDTGGGLKNALPLLGSDPVMTLNTDAVWTGRNPLRQLLDAWDPTRMDALMMCIPQQKAVGYGGHGDFIRTDDGTLRRGPGVIYGGAQILKTDALHGISDACFSLNVLWDTMLRANRVHGVLHDGYWCDVGHPGGIALAEAMLRNQDV